MKLRGHTTPNARMLVDTETGDVYLRSYATLVVCVRANGDLECYGLYSMATRKHIGWFAKLMGATFQDFKRVYENGEKINLQDRDR